MPNITIVYDNLSENLGVQFTPKIIFNFAKFLLWTILKQNIQEVILIFVSLLYKLLEFLDLEINVLSSVQLKKCFF